jgi:hypothetical protein
MEHGLDARDACLGLLQVGQLGADLGDRPAQQPHVAEDQVDAADRHQLLLPQIGGQAIGQGGTQAEKRLVGYPHSVAAQSGPHVRPEPPPHQLQEPPQGIPRRAIGTDILGAGELFADEPIELGHLLAHQLPLRDGQGANADQHDQGDQAKGQHARPNPPVLHGEQDEDARQQDRVAGHRHDQLREKVRQGAHVAVDARDQLARRVRLVERGVEPQAVEGQVLAQCVGRPPGHVLAKERGQDAQRLAAHRDPQKEHSRVDQDAQLATGHCRIDKDAHDLGHDQAQADVREEQNGQQQCIGPLWHQVRAEQGPVVPDRDPDRERALRFFRHHAAPKRGRCRDYSTGQIRGQSDDILVT